jgi:hypothetical protein
MHHCCFGKSWDILGCHYPSWWVPESYDSQRTLFFFFCNFQKIKVNTLLFLYFKFIQYSFSNVQNHVSWRKWNTWMNSHPKPFRNPHKVVHEEGFLVWFIRLPVTFTSWQREDSPCKNIHVLERMQNVSFTVEMTWHCSTSASLHTSVTWCPYAPLFLCLSTVFVLL